ncbi:hypothetical protein TGPRC2_208380 [Toxoplasma gondii TgCatPRC2]|uniref:Transmembrane protein n=1 Tax=Toxoplasma gondii TgCatPRC2 TaxID=1130821 RepID=A0A151HGM3_TOXGO|nr:hypothetical protein TGPRC2_208380 [Toxoplasma gondii TgCatPRC2]
MQRICVTFICQSLMICVCSFVEARLPGSFAVVARAHSSPDSAKPFICQGYKGVGEANIASAGSRGEFSKENFYGVFVEYLATHLQSTMDGVKWARSTPGLGTVAAEILRSVFDGTFDATTPSKELSEPAKANVFLAKDSNSSNDALPQSHAGTESSLSTIGLSGPESMSAEPPRVSTDTLHLVVSVCQRLFAPRAEGRRSFRGITFPKDADRICELLEYSCAWLAEATSQPPVQTIGTDTTETKTTIFGKSVVDKKRASPSENLEPSAVPRELQATYADVLLRPAPSVGRYSGWTAAYDMRGPQAGAVTNFGEWYPITFPYGGPSYFTPYPLQATAGSLYLPQPGVGFRRLSELDTNVSFNAEERR